MYASLDSNQTCGSEPSLTSPQYSMYGHIRQLAEAEKAGIEKAGGTADIYQYVHIVLHSPTSPKYHS